MSTSGMTKKRTMHTPGPWRIVHGENELRGRVVISGEGHGAFAEVVWQMEDDKSIGRNSPHCEANAYLVSAAPELLEALQELVSKRLEKSSCPEEADGSDGRYARARAAIAKATGVA